MELLNYKIFETQNIPEQATKPPLVILHGLLGSMDNWRSQARRLSEFQTVIILDLRNHGNSPHVEGMSYRQMYEDVLQVMQAENITNFHLLGHSMGGKVAMQLALAKPKVIESLVVVDIAPKPYPLWHQSLFHAVLTAPIDTANSRKELDDHLKEDIENASQRSFILKNIKRLDSGKAGTFAWKPNLKEISKGYLKISGFSTALAQYPKKTLFIKGADSHYIQDNDKDLIQSLFPKANIISIEGSGHNPHTEQADRFFNTMSDFYDSQHN